MENNTSSSMTEGSAPKNKRLGTRFFKNPPQPHMCIHDYLKDSWVGCYINVLSWNKMEMGDWPPNELQLYGGKKITTPKSENPETLIFFVVMNPEVLKRNGKYSQDFKEQALLIERLLNYVEIMNNGVVFKKNYKILNDRDITGELKEIWSIVQNDKVKVQEISTFDDVMRRMPYYQNYIDNVRNQQKQLHHQQQQLQHQQKIYNHQQPAQQYCQPPPQQHQHQLQQMPTQQQQQPPPPPPPQYYYGYMNPNPGPIDKCDNHELAYTFQNQIVNNPQNDRIYQSHPVTIQNNVNFHDHMYKYQHQLQQPMGAPYEVSNSHPPANLGCPNMVNPGIPQVINPGPPIQYVSMHPLENNVFVKFNRMQQPQQPQLQIAHAPPVCPYETIDTYYDPQLNFTNSIKSHSVNSSTSGNYSNLPTTAKDTSRKSISPIKVLQRDSNLGSCNKVKTLEEPARNNVMVEKKIVQVTDLDEDEGPKGQAVNDCDGTTISESVTELEKIPPQSTSESISAGTESNDSSLQQSTSVSNVFGRNRQYKKQGKTKITVLKRNNSYNDGNKSVCKDSNARKNGATCEIEGQRNYEVNKKIIEKEILESEKLNDFISGIDKNGYGNKEQINIDECPKDTSNITRKIQKQINSSSSTITINEQSGQINGQSKNIDKENGVFNQVYTILKKPESKTTQDEVINKIVQLSMKECTDSSEISDVLS